MLRRTIGLLGIIYAIILYMDDTESVELGLRGVITYRILGFFVGLIIIGPIFVVVILRLFNISIGQQLIFIGSVAVICSWLMPRFIVWVRKYGEPAKTSSKYFPQSLKYWGYSLFIPGILMLVIYILNKAGLFNYDAANEIINETDLFYHGIPYIALASGFTIIGFLTIKIGKTLQAVSEGVSQSDYLIKLIKLAKVSIIFIFIVLVAMIFIEPNRIGYIVAISAPFWFLLDATERAKKIM